MLTGPDFQAGVDALASLSRSLQEMRMSALWQENWLESVCRPFCVPRRMLMVPVSDSEGEWF